MDILYLFSSAGMLLNINELYSRLLSGEPNAEEILFIELRERFMQFANHRIWDKYEAQEVVQEAMAVITEKYRDITIEKSFAAWAYKVLDNRILSYIRKRMGKPQMVSDEIADQVIPLIKPDPDLKRKLLECFNKVNDRFHRHARVLNLSYHGYNAEEISKKIGVTRQNFYLILHRARVALGKCLKTGDIE